MDDVEKEFYEYFQELFSSTNPSKAQMGVAFERMKAKVTKEMNDQLM